MDVESSKWRIRTGGLIACQAELRHKPSGRISFPPIADVPSAHTLAMMKEADFDRTMESLA